MKVIIEMLSEEGERFVNETNLYDGEIHQWRNLLSYIDNEVRTHPVRWFSKYDIPKADVGNKHLIYDFDEIKRVFDEIFGVSVFSGFEITSFYNIFTRKTMKGNMIINVNVIKND